MKYLIVLLVLFSTSVFAHGGHGNHDVDVDITNVTEITNTADSKGVASALALGQCQYDYVPVLQGCGALGFHDGVSAVAFGLAKQVDTVLLSGGLAIEEDGDTSGSVAINFKFK